MRFIVKGRKSSREFTFSYSGSAYFAIISITDVGSKNNIFNSNNKHLVDVCRVSFDDVDFGQENCITVEDAKKILSFVNNNIDKVSFIIVQCEAGISRSAGVCAGLMKIYNGDDFEICMPLNCYVPEEGDECEDFTYCCDETISDYESCSHCCRGSECPWL
jgi:hypothetical protein